MKRREWDVNANEATDRNRRRRQEWGRMRSEYMAA